MVHLYALVDHPAHLPQVAGVGGAPILSAGTEGVDAVFSEGDEQTEADALDDAVLTHARLVEAVAGLNPAVLPARFPGRYETEVALLDAIRGRAAALREALALVRGCVEVGVRVVRQTDDADRAAGSGSDYMRRRLAAVRRAEDLAGELDAAVAATVRDGARSVTASSGVVLSAAYLVPADKADSLKGAVETVAARHADLDFVCVGPWPPYSFALVDGGAS
jgi:hypothetical protein